MPPKKKKGGAKKKGASTKKGPTTNEEIVLPSLVSEKTSTLLYTVVSSDIPSLSRLVSSYNYGNTLITTDINGSTPIHLAVKMNNTSMVTHLISYNTININALEKPIIGGYSALHHAIILGYTDIVKELIKYGANINIKANSALGESPLHVAAKENRVACAKILVDAGCKIDVRDNFGHNASFWASERGNDMLIKEVGLPPIHTATAQEYISILLAKNPGFRIGPKEKKAKKGDKKGDKKGGKKK